MPFPSASKVITTGLIMLLSLSTSACFTGYHFDLGGKESGWVGNIPIFFSDNDTAAARSFLKQYDPARISEYDFTYQSDIAVRLAFLGDYKRSLAILLRLEKEHPAEYNIASNLGTIYELTGNEEQALLYINKGISLNKNSHSGSEWVHEKILEAKIAMKKDLRWISTHHVLDDHVRQEDITSAALNERISDIVYQLKERVPFTPFPDPILADIYNTLGDLYSAVPTHDAAYICYELCEQNNGAVQYQLKEKEERAEAMIAKSGEAIPDWHIFHQSYSDNPYGVVAKDELEKAVKNPALTEKKVVEGYKAVSDFFSKKEEPSINLLPALLILFILVAALLVWRRLRQRRS